MVTIIASSVTFKKFTSISVFILRIIIQPPYA